MVCSPGPDRVHGLPAQSHSTGPQPAPEGRRMLLRTLTAPGDPEGQGGIEPKEGQSPVQQDQQPAATTPGQPHIGAVQTTPRPRCSRVPFGTTACEKVAPVLACCPPLGDQCFTAPEDAADCPKGDYQGNPRYQACCSS